MRLNAEVERQFAPCGVQSSSDQRQQRHRGMADLVEGEDQAIHPPSPSPCQQQRDNLRVGIALGVKMVLPQKIVGIVDVPVVHDDAIASGEGLVVPLLYRAGGGQAAVADDVMSTHQTPEIVGMILQSAVRFVQVPDRAVVIEPSEAVGLGAALSGSKGYAVE